MSDAISLPSNWTFQEMLSHTFPGFFSAFSIFMLIDYLSPHDLTSWAVTDLTTLISFAGFLFIMGTILGVIIDAIHHTFIEDDIFDNFSQIQIIKTPINKRLNNLCSEYGEHFTRHVFFAKIGGDKAIALDDHLDKAYYRYSEFYSNIFISLILFSLISPQYAFTALNLPWQISKSIGVASFIIACLCLVGSYTTYKQYLQAQFSLICGYNFYDDKNCKLGCKIKDELVAESDRIQIPEEILIEINDCIKDRSSKEINLLNNLKEKIGPQCDKDMLLGIIKRLGKEQEDKNNKLIDKVNAIKKIVGIIKQDDTHPSSESSKGIIGLFPEMRSRLAKANGILEMLSILSIFIWGISLIIILINLLISTAPVSLGIEPDGLDISENLTDESSLKYPFDTLILTNYGEKLDINFQINGIKEKWLSIRDNDSDINTTSLLPGETRYLRISLLSRNILNENAMPGTYKGSIQIFYEGHDDLKTKIPDKGIPLTLNLTKIKKI